MKEKTKSLPKTKIKKSDVIAASIIIAIFSVSIFVVKPVAVKGKSMEPTLKEGDYRIVYTLKDPKKIKRGEVIVFKNDGVLLIKRVIGKEGDLVETEGSSVKLNGKVLDEKDYIKTPPKYEKGNWLVPKDSFFVMGDNRGKSIDSRGRIGFVKSNEVIGTVKE